MTSPTTSSSVAHLRRRLAGLRSRVRRISALAGVSRVVLVAAGALVLFFLADWTLDLPLDVRRFVRLGLLDRPSWLPFAAWVPALAVAIALAVGSARAGRPTAGLFAFVAGGLVGVVAWTAARALWAPLSVALPDVDLALSVEERHRALEERLVTALDFERTLSEGEAGPESAAMMEHVVADADREASALAFSRVASSRAAWRRAAAAAGVVAVGAAVALLAPDAVALWARRSLLLEERAWPRGTTIVAVVEGPGGAEVEKDPAEPYVVALGRPLSVLARARGRAPGEAFLLDRVPGSDVKPLRLRMRPVAGRPGLFEAKLGDVREAFEFTLAAGDDVDDVPRYSVAVRVPPRVLSIAADLRFPEYLGQAPRRVEGGALDVPEGTVAEVTFETDADVATAEAFVEDRPVKVEGGPRAHRLTLTADRTARYRLRFVTVDGRENEAADATYDVTVRPDAPPRPDWVHPRIPLEASPVARVPLFARTTDDHGVASVALEVRVGAEATVSVPLGPRGPSEAGAGAANDRAYGASSILSYVPLDLGALPGSAPPVPPVRLSLRVVATDTKGQRGEGEWTSVDVMRADEVERALAGRRTVVKADVAAVRADVAAARETVAGLRGAPVGDAERSALREAQFKLGKARSDLERAVRSLATLWNGYVYGRLGATSPTEKILAILDRRHRALFSHAEGGPEDGEPEALRAGDGEAAVFPWSVYSEVVAARADGAVFDAGVLDKMIAALEPALEAVVADGPAAVAAISEAAGASEPALDPVVAAQDRWLATLDRALAAMQEWQNLSDLVLQLRRLVEEQEAIHGRIDTPGAAPSGEPGPDGGAR